MNLKNVRDSCLGLCWKDIWHDWKLSWESPREDRKSCLHAVCCESSTSSWSFVRRLIATWAAIIRLLLVIKIQFWHSQSFHLQNLLCPFSVVRTPWCLHRAHSGVFFCERSIDPCSIDIFLIKILNSLAWNWVRT